MTTLSALPPTVESYVSDFVARARRRALARAVGTAGAAFLAWSLACCAADRAAQLPQWLRLALLLVGVAGAALILRRPLLAARGGRADVLDAAAEIERHDPRFAQRLVTVVSRLLGPPQHRGSDEILFRLLTDVSRQTEAGRAPKTLPLHTVLLPWAALAGLVVLTASLARLPDFGLPRLAVRFLVPLAPFEPVTTTKLHVLPGDADVVQSRPLRIDVSAHRLWDGGSAWVWLREEGGGWTRRPMNRGPRAPGDGDRATFSFTLPAVGRDLRYYVSGGDATSRE